MENKIRKHITIKNGIPIKKFNKVKSHLNNLKGLNNGCKTNTKSLI